MKKFHPEILQQNMSTNNAVLRIRIRLIRDILASWIRIRKNMRIQGQNIKHFFLKPFALKNRSEKNNKCPQLTSEWFEKLLHKDKWKKN